MHNIRNKSVLITGAGRGIGKRLALGFAEAGARVGMVSRSQAELDLAKLEIEQAGGKVAGLYAGSWAEWGARDDCPVATGAAPAGAQAGSA